MTSDVLSMTSYPLFRTSHHFMYVIKSHCICPHIHCICVITPNISMTSHPLHEWYYMQYICDIISPMFLTKYPLSMTSQHSVLMSLHTLGVYLTSFAMPMISHPLYHTKQRYLWRYIHFTHHITPLYQTLHLLYLCHHNLSTDITPTFEWHHTHPLCDILCPI